MSRLKSSIQLNPERKITSHCNRLPHRKSSSTTPCIAWRNNNLAIFRTINPVKKRVLLFEINNVNVMMYIRKNLFFAIWFSKFFNFQFSFEIFQEAYFRMFYLPKIFRVVFWNLIFDIIKRFSDFFLNVIVYVLGGMVFGIFGMIQSNNYMIIFKCLRM